MRDSGEDEPLIGHATFAAANAESAAKLVSEHDMQTHPGSSIRVCADCGAGEVAAKTKSCISAQEKLQNIANEIHASWVCERQGEGEFTPDWIDSLYVRIERIAATLIERHATPQKQATHGEGEAEGRGQSTMYQRMYFEVQKLLDVALGPNEEDGSGGGIVGDVALLIEQRDQARAKAATSPTAAPLGELAKGLLDAIPPNRQDTDLVHLSIREVREIAAALSGVAAQGAVTECEHEWVCADNSIVKGASMCLKCHAICATASISKSAAAQGDKPRFDEAQFAEMTRKGAEAWKDVPDVAAWINEQRGDGEARVSDGFDERVHAQGSA